MACTIGQVSEVDEKSGRLIVGSMLHKAPQGTSCSMESRVDIALGIRDRALLANPPPWEYIIAYKGIDASRSVACSYLDA